MNIIIRSQDDAATEVRQEPGKWSVISIRGPEDGVIPIDNHTDLCADVLVVEFDDVWKQMHEDRGWGKLATPEQLTEILKWAEGKENILVHCFAGICRSSAVAFLIGSQAEGPESAMRFMSTKLHTPNEWVIRLGAHLLKNREIERVFDQKWGQFL